MEKEKEFNFERKVTLEKLLLHIESASLCPLSLNTMFSPQYLPLLMENLIVSLIWACLWWRPSWKELSFSIPNYANMEVCNIFTYVDHLLIEILFSRPIDILQIYWIIIPWVYLSCLLMDYAIECANII